MSETVGYVGKLTLHKKYKDADELQANLQNFGKAFLEKSVINTIKM